MAQLDDLLLKTSRTFALSIPQLPEPTRQEVTIAYLLFRIADTYEDASRWSSEHRVQALQAFGGQLKNGNFTSSSMPDLAVVGPPVDHEGYLELLAETPFVLDSFHNLHPDAQAAIRDHLLKTVQGMADFVARDPEAHSVELTSLDELREYCYYVAGLVGEMLTELFLLGRPQLAGIASALRSRSRDFGEALQLVNILKDASVDAGEGRTFLPREVSRDDVFALARSNLLEAAKYVHALQEAKAPLGMVRFCALPVLLAEGALTRVEEQGPGAKLSRDEVFATMEAMESDLREQRPISFRRS